MYATAEIRWFSPGTVEPDVAEWFDSLPGKAEDQPWRVDYYLRVTAVGDALGIKLRQGRLEIKQRTAAIGPRQMDLWVIGLLELWQKWSVALDPGMAVPPSPAASWTAVHKRRRLRRYRLRTNLTLEPVPLNQLIADGCDLELTRVVAGGETWWTLGFEAFGGESAVEQVLFPVALVILDMSDPPILGIENSFGYPHWLQLIRDPQ
jgi:hypothetical protein